MLPWLIGRLPATWNAADKSASLTLSNGNLTATNNNGSIGSVRSTRGASTGKKYFTWVFNSSGNGDAYCGLEHGNYSLGTAVGSTGSISLNDSGALFISGNPTSIGTVIPNVSVQQLAWDVDSQLSWFRIDSGLWNGDAGANPATGANGTDLAALGFPKTLVAAASFFDLNEGVTANFGATAFSPAAPSGFTGAL